MKGAQERLEANNRKKEEFFTMQKNKKEQAILEQSEIHFELKRDVHDIIKCLLSY